MNKQKVILVTGSSSKLGESIVQKLLNSKHKVCRGQRKGGDITIDVSSEGSCEKAIQKVIKQYKRLDVVVNVAGLTESGTVINASPKQFQQLLEVNALGQMRVNLLASKQMLRQKSGQIINITSLSGKVPLPGFGIYSASKSAAESLNEVLHYELLSSHVRVTNIAPGAINFKGDSEKSLAHRPVREKIPLLKYLLPMTTPEKIADKISNLIDSSNNPIRITMGVDAHIITFLYQFLPSFIFEKIILYLWQKK